MKAFGIPKLGRFAITAYSPKPILYDENYHNCFN